MRLTVTLLLIATAFALPVSSLEFLVFDLGTFHGDDVKPLDLKIGDKYLALFPSGQGYHLEETELRIEAVQDDLLDDQGQTTGRKLSVSDKRQPLFLVRGLPQQAGKTIPTLLTDRELRNGMALPLSLGQIQYTLEVRNPNSKEPTISPGSVVTLASQGTSQVLFDSEDFADEPGWRLIWAGDLDGDGKLDLYVDLSHHYNVSDKRLFLSSAAEPGKLVKEVAHFSTSGC